MSRIIVHSGVNSEELVVNADAADASRVSKPWRNDIRWTLGGKGCSLAGFRSSTPGYGISQVNSE